MITDTRPLSILNNFLYKRNIDNEWATFSIISTIVTKDGTATVKK